MVRIIRKLLFVSGAVCLLLAPSEAVKAAQAGWSCSSPWDCDLDEGHLSDCYACPIESICYGVVQYDECVEDHEGGWRQHCQCIPVAE